MAGTAPGGELSLSGGLDETGTNALGLALIAIACLVPLIWLPGIAEGRDLVALFSQYIGMVALIVMALAHLIATRWPGVETVFGPLDRSYKIHKWLGIAGLSAVLLHDTIDAEMDGLGRETVLVQVAETLGEISLYGLLILVVITVATFIPYHLWKWTHRLIGIFFVFGALHYLFILKPFNNGDPLGLYMGAVCVIGILAYLYTSAPRGVRPSRTYRISALSQEGSALAIDMAPEGRGLTHAPGQFAFFAFTGAGMSEPHPFTISCAPCRDGALRVTVAPLGDLTSRLVRALAEGQPVTAEGPFGHFGRGASGPQVWIAAGVGVTPFVALAEALDPAAPTVRMIYAVRSAQDAPHLSALEALAETKPNFALTLWESAEQGRLDADDVAGLTGDALGQARVLFCGPVEMRKALAAGLSRQGVAQSRFHYEEFEIRTGIGLRRLARWLRAKV